VKAKDRAGARILAQPFSSAMGLDDGSRDRQANAKPLFLGYERWKSLAATSGAMPEPGIGDVTSPSLEAARSVTRSCRRGDSSSPPGHCGSDEKTA